MIGEIWCYQLSSGIQVIGKVVKTDHTLVMLSNPFEMSISVDVSGNNRLYFSRWLPYNKPSYEVVIFQSAVEAMTAVDQNFMEYYEQKVKQFTRLANSDVDEYQGEDDVQEEESVPVNSVKGNTTKHW